MRAATLDSYDLSAESLELGNAPLRFRQGVCTFAWYHCASTPPPLALPRLFCGLGVVRAAGAVVAWGQTLGNTSSMSTAPRRPILSWNADNLAATANAFNVGTGLSIASSALPQLTMAQLQHLAAAPVDQVPTLEDSRAAFCAFVDRAATPAS